MDATFLFTVSLSVLFFLYWFILPSPNDAREIGSDHLRLCRGCNILTPKKKRVRRKFCHQILVWLEGTIGVKTGIPSEHGLVVDFYFLTKQLKH